MNTLRILHLEDDVMDAELVRSTLIHEGLTVETRRIDTRDEFLEMIGKQEFDLILADYSLPSFDGLTALVLALEKSPGIPFILVSGELGEDLAIEAMKAGATDYVLKNNLSRLAPAVRRAIRETEEVKARKRAVAESVESELRYRHLFDAALDVIMLIDVNTGEVIDVNAAGLSAYGFTREEFIGKKVTDFTAEKEKTLNAIESVAEQGRIRIAERLHVRKDGTRFPVEVSAALFDIRGRQVAGSFLRDITERKQAQDELNLLATAVEQSAESIVITDLTGDIRYVNSTFEEVSGYSRFEVLGKNPRIVQSGAHSAEFYEDLWSTISSGKVWSGLFENISKSGNTFFERATITPVTDANGNPSAYVAVKRDVTGELARERELSRAQRLEALGQLAGGIAHDFNNLLMVISGSADLLRTKCEDFEGDFAEVDTILATVSRGAELTRRLLAVARQQVLEIRPLSVAQRLEDEVKILRRVIPESIEITLGEVDEDLFMSADAAQIARVLMNLAVNARDAMPDGGVLSISADRVSLDAVDVAEFDDVDAGDYVRISVADTGEGMDEQILTKVFEPFFSTKEEGKGTGMGLATVYGIVKQHQGFIEVTSELGVGTTFRIHLPRVEAVESAAVVVEEADTAAGGERILVVEDDKNVRWAVTSILKRFGYQVQEAENGEVALEMLRENVGGIDLVVSDVVMPRMNGTELYRAARDEGCPAAFLFSSGYANRESWEELVDENDAHFIPKPYGMDQLAAKVREVLKAHHEKD